MLNEKTATRFFLVLAKVKYLVNDASEGLHFFILYIPELKNVISYLKVKKG